MTEGPTMPPWPTDDEVDANFDFWMAVLMARGLFEPSGTGGTGKDLGYWYESTESAAPPTPLMRQWLAYLWQQVPDRKPSGRREGSRGVVQRSENLEATYDLARRVAERQTQWLAEPEQSGRQNVPSDVTRDFIVKEITAEGSRYPRTWLDDVGRVRLDVEADVLRLLKNKNRLLQPQ
jgi:hypothetical protein